MVSEVGAWLLGSVYERVVVYRKKDEIYVTTGLTALFILRWLSTIARVEGRLG
jgi:hypothetical protein